jgi:ATP-dependent Clp protease adaptor protein ClpS
VRLATSPTTAPRTDEETRTRQVPPYNVILLNDDHHSMEFVIEVLRKVFGYPQEKSFGLMMEAHKTGRAVIWTGPKEVAELKGEQIDTHHEKRPGRDLGPLGYRIEPAPG